MNDPVTWADLLTIAKWYVAVSVGTFVVCIGAGLLLTWWENRK